MRKKWELSRQHKRPWIIGRNRTGTGNDQSDNGRVGIALRWILSHVHLVVVADVAELFALLQLLQFPGGWGLPGWDAHGAEVGGLAHEGDVQGVLPVAARQHGDEAHEARKRVEEAGAHPVRLVKQGRFHGSQAAEEGEADVVGQADARGPHLCGKELYHEMVQQSSGQSPQQSEAHAEGHADRHQVRGVGSDDAPERQAQDHDQC
mmetsp:Transcript_78509/g.172086  ORF Transcript_78509/g.172086 Transcript_78509/m.172086 type:complete len:206 (-) Transcript_78509:1109-1726(-)